MYLPNDDAATEYDWDLDIGGKEMNKWERVVLIKCVLLYWSGGKMLEWVEGEVRDNTKMVETVSAFSFPFSVGWIICSVPATITVSQLLSMILFQ